jgi:hypothetical protein
LLLDETVAVSEALVKKFGIIQYIR